MGVMGSVRPNRGAIRAKNLFRPSVQITSWQAEHTNPAVVLERLAATGKPAGRSGTGSARNDLESAPAQR